MDVVERIVEATQKKCAVGIRQLQENCLCKKKNLYFALVDLAKAFDRVACGVVGNEKVRC